MKKPDQNGFTLIELLVVIAVLALLLSVILPALNSAKLTAKKVVCASKMKQWALAEMAYVDENDFTITPYADTYSNSSPTGYLISETYYCNRLSPYLIDEDFKYNNFPEMRRCPMGKANPKSIEEAVGIGVYYGYYYPEKAPFVFLNSWDGTNLIKRCNPVKMSEIRSPASYLMMLDTGRDVMLNPILWKWNYDYDEDGIYDSLKAVISSLGPYSMAKPKIHRGGCNVSLFDGHVEWVRYEDFWDYADGYPTHQYWYNGNRPDTVAASSSVSP